MILNSNHISLASRWATYYILIGLVAGMGSIIFQYLCQFGVHVFLDQMAGYLPPPPAGEEHLFPPSGTPFNRWILLILPALGGLVSGWLVYTFAPEAEGHGTDAAIEAYHKKGGFIRGRIPFIKTIASAITITTGGSGGREGPIAQIGAGFGSFLGRVLHLSERDRRIMLAAGMGAGIGSIFRAPLAGALFASEVLYSDPQFEADVLIPCGISSVVAYCLFCVVFGGGSLFSAQDFVFQTPLELGPYVILTLVLVAGGICYVKCFYGVHDLAKSLNIPNFLKPALGGLCTGVIGFFLPQTLAFGYGYAQMAIDNQLPVLLLFGIAFGKILTTSFSIGSGGSGGVFGPSVVIGGTLGGAVGRIFHALIPGMVIQPGAYVIVGMAGFFSAISNAPISTILFVSEMTNSYHLLLPSLLVCTLSYILARKWTIYVQQVKSPVDSDAHRGDFFVDVLSEIKVRELLPHLRKVNLIPEHMPFSRVRRVFSDSQQQYFPVVDKNQRLTGIFSINDIRGILFDQEIGDVVVARDVANSQIIVTRPSEDLNEVLKKFTMKNLNQLPVVQDDDPGVLLGMLDRREVIEFYNQRIQEVRTNGGNSQDRGTEPLPPRMTDAQVKDAFTKDAMCIREDENLNDVRDTLSQSRFRSFPVVDQKGRLTGILSLSDYENIPADVQPAPTIRKISTSDVVTVTEAEPLFSALGKISSGDFAILPVIDPKERTVLGIISRSDILRTLHRSMKK